MIKSLYVVKTMLNQTNFPWLWLLFQYTVGGNADKKRLLLKTYHGERNILEVGCSVGNLAEAFLSVKHVQYYGLDVDSSAIQVAQRRFEKYPNFAFTCASLASFIQTAPKFDLIYFAGVLHHTPDEEALSLLRCAVPLLNRHTRLIVIEPHPAADVDPPLVRYYARSLERGKHLRSMDSLRALVNSVGGVNIQSAWLAPIGATPISWPLCANFIVLEAGLAQETNS